MKFFQDRLAIFCQFILVFTCLVSFPLENVLGKETCKNYFFKKKNYPIIQKNLLFLDSPKISFQKKGIHFFLTIPQKNLVFLQKKLIDGSFRQRISILKILKKRRASITLLPALISQLSFPHPLIRKRAILVICQYKKKALPFLEKALQSEKLMVRESAFLGFEKLKSSSEVFVPLLLQRWKDQNDYQNFCISQTLQKIGKPVLLHLSPYLCQRKYSQIALEVILKIKGSPRPILKDLLKIIQQDPSFERKKQAIFCLEKLEKIDLSVLSVLLNLVTNENTNLQKKIKIIFSKQMILTPKLKIFLKKQTTHPKIAIRKILCHLFFYMEKNGQLYMDSLISMLKDCSYSVRLASSKAICKLGLAEKKDLRRLFYYYEKGDEKIKINLLKSIQKNSIPLSYSHLYSLCRFFSKGTFKEKMELIETLKGGKEEAFPFLQEIFSSTKEEKMRCKILYAMGFVGVKALKILRQYQFSKVQSYCQQAVSSMLSLGEPALFDLILELNRPNHKIHKKILELLKTSPAKIKIIQTYFFHSTPSSHGIKILLKMLNHFPKEGIPLSMKCIKKNINLRKLVIENLEKKIKDPLFQKNQSILFLALVQLFLDPRKEVYLSARKLLRQINKPNIPYLLLTCENHPIILKKFRNNPNYFQLKKRLRFRVIIELIFWKKQALPYLQKGVKSKNQDLKKTCILLLGI